MDRIYDYCAHERSVTRCVPLLGVPTPAAVKARLLPATCTVANRTGGDDGRSHVSLTVTVPVKATAGDTVVSVPFVLFETVAMTAPPGTDIECTVTGDCAAEAVDLDGDGRSEELCCMAHLQLVVQSKAPVKLLVPSLGYCLPRDGTEPAPAATPRPPGAD